MNCAKIILVVSIINALHTYPMETKQDIGPCYFANLPTDVLDLIAHFWYEYETYEEFIKRTFAMVALDIQNPKHPIFQYGQFLGIGINEIRPGLWSYSPDETKIAYLKDYYQQKTLTIVDLQKKKEEAILYNENIDIQYPVKMALSNAATMIAVFEARRHYEEPPSAGGLRHMVETWRVENVLEIRKFGTPTVILEIPFASAYEGHAVAFNRQGTHLLVLFTPRSGEYIHLKLISLRDVENPIDIPCKDVETVKNIAKEKNLDLKAKQTLQDCLRSRGICKNISSNTKK